MLPHCPKGVGGAPGTGRSAARPSGGRRERDDRGSGPAGFPPAGILGRTAQARPPRADDDGGVPRPDSGRFRGRPFPVGEHLFRFGRL